MTLDFDNLGFTFDEAEEKSEMNFDVLPAGEYEMIIKSVEEKIASTGTVGRGIIFSVVNPEQYRGKNVFKDCWLEGKTPATTETMFGMFSGFLNQCGVSKEAKALLFKAGYPANGLFIELSEKLYTVQVSEGKYTAKDGTVKDKNDFVKITSVKAAGASF